MAFLLCVWFILCVASASEACSCAGSHPQEMFCSSDFVIRAKVLAKTQTGDYHLVYDLRITKTFKGAAKINQTEGFEVYGSNGLSLKAKAYTASMSSLCGVDSLRNDTVYLLAGTISKRGIELSACNWNQEWSRVTYKQRIGLRRFYGENCECKTTTCYSNCDGKLEGCKLTGRDWGGCEWLHSYCLKNTNSNTCSWRETAEYKNCTSLAIP